MGDSFMLIKTKQKQKDLLFDLLETPMFQTIPDKYDFVDHKISKEVVLIYLQTSLTSLTV